LQWSNKKNQDSTKYKMKKDKIFLFARSIKVLKISRVHVFCQIFRPLEKHYHIISQGMTQVLILLKRVILCVGHSKVMYFRIKHQDRQKRLKEKVHVTFSFVCVFWFHLSFMYIQYPTVSVSPQICRCACPRLLEYIDFTLMC
jgi:hypothetical protein